MLKPKRLYNLTFNRRLFLLSSVKLITLSFVINRLYNLQIKQSEKYKKLADNNRVNFSFIIPSRGLIFDRNKMGKEGFQRINNLKKVGINNLELALKDSFESKRKAFFSPSCSFE